MKDFWVVFHKPYVRIEKDSNLVPVGIPYAKNPNLEAVKGFPPHLWKLKRGKVVKQGLIERNKTRFQVYVHIGNWKTHLKLSVTLFLTFLVLYIFIRIIRGNL